ncbi:DUF1571 domain-containing protein [Paraburkholderia phymatum]|uniref:DUF1571 domain-containing protein n=1 Tax=Paraburkholderia phymatum TaxID=148447 RepID=A0ACC6TU07_9BURK
MEKFIVQNTGSGQRIRGADGRRRQHVKRWLANAALAAIASCAVHPALAQAADTRTADSAPALVGKLAVDQQVRWLRQTAQTGALAKLDDAQLVTLFEALDPQTVPRYVKEGPNGYPSYEFTMRRQERIKGERTTRPDHMLVRMTREPLRIYMTWLPDGPHAGQEAIYDETKRGDAMYGHLGGMLNIMPIWTSLDGSLARAQSNHSVRDLGTEFVATQFVSEAARYADAGALRPRRVEVRTIDSVRVIALTYEVKNGMSGFYAKKKTLGLDLRWPYFRTVEAYDDDGQLFEKIVLESVTPKTFDASTFDPKNPAYRF